MHLLKIRSVKFLGLRFNGADWPLALLEINGHYGVYEHDALVYMAESQQQAGLPNDTLKQVLCDVELNRHGNLSDLCDADISGQHTLFSA